jgi:hypothetical protein
MIGKVGRAVGGILLMLLGLVWLLQGLNVLPGSFMTGSAFWGLAGALVFTLGALIVYSALTSRKEG